MHQVTIPQAFELALQYHRNGWLSEAERIFRQIAAVQPDHSDAWRMLGLVENQRGRYDVALESIRKAIAVDRNNATAHFNLGDTYRLKGCLEEAISEYRRAVDLRPDFAEAYNSLGNALRIKGKFEDARRALQRAVQLKPQDPDAHTNLGILLADEGRLDESVAAFQRVLQIAPDRAELHTNLGIALAKQLRFGEAEKAYRQSLELRPNDAGTHNELGRALAGLGRLEEAVASFGESVHLNPSFAEAYNNLGGYLTDLGKPAQAVVECERALKIRPDYPEAYTNLGNALKDLGQIDQARVAYQRSLELAPHLSGTVYNFGYLLLLCGDLQAGWPLYEARLNTVVAMNRRYPQPFWDGTAMSGRLLLHAEQGFGDAIQFVRYVPLLAKRGLDVVVECQRPLVELFRRATGVRDVVASDDPPPQFDSHLPMLSLPLRLKTTAETIPRDVPYVFADPASIEAWRNRLGNRRSELRIGLAWAGNHKQPRDRIRTISLERLLPLLQIHGLTWYSLQVGDEALQNRPLSRQAAIIDHTGLIGDFADTAALMMELDLIITVDTAVAHLAGALGRPVWTLLPFVPDWRWGLESDTTPWYPTMRLFRQPALADWDSVVLRVADELRLLAEHSR